MNTLNNQIQNVNSTKNVIFISKHFAPLLKPKFTKEYLPGQGSSLQSLDSTVAGQGFPLFTGPTIISRLLDRLPFPHVTVQGSQLDQ